MIKTDLMCGWMIQNHCTRSTTKAPNCGVDKDCLVSCRMYMPALPWNRKWRFSKMKWCQKFSWQQEVAALWKTIIALTLWRNKCAKADMVVFMATCVLSHSETPNINTWGVWMNTMRVPLFRPRNWIYLIFHSFTAAAHCRHTGVSYLIDMSSFECKGPMYLLHMKTRL